MSIQLGLPTDVLEAVIDQASDNIASLRHISLTCTTLLPRSRYHLFSNLIVRTMEQLDAFPEFLDSCPWLVPLVREVTLFPTVPDDNDHPNIHLLVVVPIHLLTRLPNLLAWTVKTRLRDSVPEFDAPRRPSLALHHSTLWCYRKYGGRIRNLELSVISFYSISDFRGLVSAFNSLDSLTCHRIGFQSRERHPVMAGTEATNVRTLQTSTLKISTSVHSWAMEYLLACSGSELKHLTIQLLPLDCTDDYLAHLEQAITQVPPMFSLVLVICLDRRLIGIEENDRFSRVICSAATILKHVNRGCLMHVRIEFQADPLAHLGARLSRASARLEACERLEEALLTFSNASLLVRDLVRNRRLGRAKFWSPIIRRAFPKLNERGLLTLKFTPSKEGASDPVGHEDKVTCIVISHDSARVVTSSEDGTIIVWDTAGGAVLHEWVPHQGSNVEALALSPDSRWLVSSGGHALTIWDIDDGYPVKVVELEGHTDIVDACTWSPDGALIASASWDSTVRIWDGHT